MIQDNIARIRERIADVCLKAGRKTEEVHLLAVTKNVPAEKIAEALSFGVGDIGESRIQESGEKFSLLRPSHPTVQWHMIGHLQRNKVNRAVEVFDVLQSVDSKRLLEAVERRAGELGKAQRCLVEIKVSEEAEKTGLPLNEIEDFMGWSVALKNVRIEGLMTIAPYFEDQEKTRPYFAQARRQFEKFFKTGILSMGMSSDFEAAIQEGSTMVRVGTAIFGERS
jgi:pyridoxal phosphate enzyme (YggS family)